MESLGFFDIVWRVMVAGGIAITPGMAFLILLLGLPAVVRRLCHHIGLTSPASDAPGTQR